MEEPTPPRVPATHDRGLVALFVDRPVTTLMLTIAILAIGAIALTRMPLQLAPDGLTAGSVNLWIPIRRDMPPREVEERVARPLEEQLRTIPGIRRHQGSASWTDSEWRRALVLEQLGDPSLDCESV